MATRTSTGTTLPNYQASINELTSHWGVIGSMLSGAVQAASPTPSPQQTAPTSAPASQVAQGPPVISAIMGATSDPNVRLAMAMGSYMEGGWGPTFAPGDYGTSFGPFQAHYGGQLGDFPGGVGQQIAEATDPSTSVSEHFLGQYQSAVNQVGAAAFQANPGQAAAQAAYIAESPQAMYSPEKIQQAYAASTGALSGQAPIAQGAPIGSPEYYQQIASGTYPTYGQQVATGQVAPPPPGTNMTSLYPMGVPSPGAPGGYGTGGMGFGRQGIGAFPLLPSEQLPSENALASLLSWQLEPTASLNSLAALSPPQSGGLANLLGNTSGGFG